MKPIAYILCGLPGSGKTTYAKNLEQKENIIRYSLDEEVFKRFGKEFDSSLYSEYEKQTKEDLLKSVKNKLMKGESAILDYGFWKKTERDTYKLFIGECGAEWKLLYFKQDKDDLLNRIQERSQENNHVISPDLLDSFIESFEEPVNEGEIIIS